MANGVLYESAGGQRVVAALDAATGKQLWLWNGMDENGRDRKAPRRNAGRGVGYWTDGREERIFVITTGFYLVALNAKTGMPVREFGVNGAVDLMKELNVDFDHVSRIGNSSPPMVYRDTVIVPPALEEGFVPSSMRNTPGYVMAFDARTGKQKWAFHTVPKNGEPGAETWEQNANTYTGNTGVWAPISVDPELGYAYLPIETPTDDYYGGHRLGQQSVRQLRCRRRSRDRQAHLALPDHAPRHLELRSLLRSRAGEHDGQRPARESTRAAHQAGLRLCARPRDGRAHLADRRARVPASDVPGERAWPTQPHPTKPAPFDYQGYNENDLIDFTPDASRRGDQDRKAVSPRSAVHAAFGDQGQRHQGHVV